MKNMHSESSRIIVLIPAYKPDERLVTLVRELLSRKYEVLTIDDGGGQKYLPLFDQCMQNGAKVVRHSVNMGKGRALKTGLNAIVLEGTAGLLGVITADADGQHTPDDIDKVAEAMREQTKKFVLGSRAFTGNVPFKSRAGNAITRVVYTLASGVKVHDTQTGLRGLPVDSLEAMVRIDGERYEYEMNVLLKLHDMGLSVIEVPIETIYIDDNKGSHFNPVRDAWRIYRVILGYLFASISSFVIDYALYLFVLSLTFRTWGMPEVIAGGVSYVVARAVSSFYNYQVNKYAVFGSRGGKGAIFRYYALVVVQAAIGAGITMLLSSTAHISASWVKLPIDICLFFVNYVIQRDFVFKDRKRKA